MLFAWQDSLFGQRWYGPYQEGVKAVEQGLQDDAPSGDAVWQQAIQQLQQAIAADPKPDGGKFVEGTFRAPYFPYLYLGIAHLRAGNLQEAERNFKESRDRGEAPKDNKVAARQLALYEGELSDKLAAASATPEGTGPSEAFEAKVSQAEAHLDQNRWQQAIAGLDEAEKLDPGEFASRDLSARRDSARQSWAQEKASSAQRLLSGGSLNQARTLFEEATQIWPGLNEATQGLATIRSREQQYQRTKSQAEQSYQSQDYRQARQLYLEAQSAHPVMAADDNLSAVLIDLDDRIAAIEAAASSLQDCIDAFDQGNYEQAKTLCGQASGDRAQRYVDRAEARLVFQQGQQEAEGGNFARAEELYQRAQELDGNYSEASQALQSSREYRQAMAEAQRRYQRWGGDLQQLSPLSNADVALERAARADPNRFRSDSGAQSLRRNIDQAIDQASRQATAQDPVNQQIRQAALDLFEGRIGEARQALETIQQPNAHVHFFLGVAYATSALEDAAGPDSRQLRSQALAQFQMALKMDADYPPPKRLVSPLILGLFEQARQ